MRSNSDLRKKIEDYSYSLHDILHEGSSSRVYRGVKESTKQPVAIKVVDIKGFKSKDDKKALDSQIEVIRKLTHPNILNCLDVYSTINNCYIITQYCDGESLKSMLKKKKSKLKEQEVVRLFRGICRGYKYLYSKGFIHHNLQPSNILIKNGECKLADFGLTSKDLNYRLRSNSPLLVSSYHDPDEIKEGVLKYRCDIYSLGTVLFELFHNRLPFDPSKNLKSLSFDNIPQDTKDLIKKCLGVENVRLSVEEFLSHPYVNSLCSNSSNVGQRQNHDSIPLTKVISCIENRPTTFEEEKKRYSNKHKAQNSMRAQINFMRFLYQLYQYLPKGQLQFAVIKQLLSILETLKKCMRLANPYNLDSIHNFFMSDKAFSIKDDVTRCTKKYSFLDGVLKEYVAKEPKDKRLLSHWNSDLERSEGVIVAVIAITLNYIQSTLAQLKRELKNHRDEEALQQNMQQKVLSLDFAITYYQLNCVCVDNWHDLDRFSELSRVEEITSIQPSPLTKRSIAGLEKKMKDLDV